MKLKDTHYSIKEITAILNNAVIFQQDAIRNLSAARATRLKEYSAALIEPVYEHMEEDLLTPQEAVFILSAAALILHMKVNKIKSLPAKEKIPYE